MRYPTPGLLGKNEKKWKIGRDVKREPKIPKALGCAWIIILNARLHGGAILFPSKKKKGQARTTNEETGTNPSDNDPPTVVRPR